VDLSEVCGVDELAPPSELVFFLSPFVPTFWYSFSLFLRKWRKERDSAAVARVEFFYVDLNLS